MHPARPSGAEREDALSSSDQGRSRDEAGRRRSEGINPKGQALLQGEMKKRPNQRPRRKCNRKVCRNKLHTAFGLVVAMD